MRRQVALPGDHGSWVFLFSPLLIGLFAGGRWSAEAGVVTVAALAAFLARQPVTTLVKAYSGRRSREDLPAAWFWTGVYGAVGLLAAATLVARGYAYVLYLAVPGVPVFAWHLVLVSQRAERRQLGVELVATGVLALAATAAYWVGRQGPEPAGWCLGALAWLQSAASIVYAYARLEQRVLPGMPDLAGRLRLGWKALLYTTFNLAFVAALAAAGNLPRWVFLPYLLQWGETVWGTLARPAVGARPAAIGVRQLIVSTLFTVVFVAAWGAG